MAQLGPERLQRRVGARLAAVREGAGLTQEELASRLGIAARNVQRVEAGRQNLTLQTIERFAKALGLDPTAIVTISEGRVRGGPPMLHAVADRDGRPPPVVPILSLEVAAGYARTGRVPSALGWTLLNDRVDGRAFIAQVGGRSMEPLIPERSWSLFRAADTVAVGKIALIELHSRGEAEADRAYVVKKIRERTRKRILLSSANPAFGVTELQEGAAASARIVAEWIRVVS